MARRSIMGTVRKGRSKEARRFAGQRGEVVLKAIRPNAGTEALYRKKIDGLVAQMAASVQYWIEAKYRQNPPEMAMDAVPANVLKKEIGALRSRWEKQFYEAAPRMAEWFSRSVETRTSADMRRILKDGGFSVEFKMTAGMRDVLNANIAENVGLIRSIPQQYLGEVEGLVMRSVQRGRDLGELAKDLEARYPITKRRAALIARDQNNKATSVMQEARRKEIGVTHAIWMHSGGGKEPRPKHVAASGKRYEVGVGLPIGDKGEYVLPGQMINCRCVSRAVVKGFD